MALGTCLRSLSLAWLVGACAPQMPVQTWAVNDLLAAEADARAHNDVTALCWAGLRWYVQAKVLGIATSVQLARDIVRDEVTRNACAPIALDIMAIKSLALPTLLATPLP